MKIFKESRKPKVGIFFIIDGVVFSDPFEKDELNDVNGFIDGDSSHYEYWKFMQKYYPDYRKFDYDYYPRGRVIYDKKNDNYKIILDNCVNNKDLISSIVSEFCIPSNKYTVETDEHYKCKNCNKDYVMISENYKL